MKILVKPAPRKIPARNSGGATQLLCLTGDLISSVPQRQVGLGCLPWMRKTQSELRWSRASRFRRASTVTQLQTRPGCKPNSQLYAVAATALRPGRAKPVPSHSRFPFPASTAAQSVETLNVAGHPVLEGRPSRGHCQRLKRSELELAKIWPMRQFIGN